jgi:hypothetical protein
VKVSVSFLCVAPVFSKFGAFARPPKPAVQAGMPSRDTRHLDVARAKGIPAGLSLAFRMGSAIASLLDGINTKDEGGEGECIQKSHLGDTSNQGAHPRLPGIDKYTSYISVVAKMVESVYFVERSA